MKLAPEALPALEARLQALGAEAVADLHAQAVADERISVVRRVHLRYEGTDSALIVLFDTIDGMKSQFEAGYRKRFFLPDGLARR